MVCVSAGTKAGRGAERKGQRTYLVESESGIVDNVVDLSECTVQLDSGQPSPRLCT